MAFSTLEKLKRATLVSRLAFAWVNLCRSTEATSLSGSFTKEGRDQKAKNNKAKAASQSLAFDASVGGLYTLTPPDP
jgi:hypothetical protein